MCFPKKERKTKAEEVYYVKNTLTIIHTVTVHTVFRIEYMKNRILGKELVGWLKTTINIGFLSIFTVLQVCTCTNKMKNLFVTLSSMQ